MYLDDQYRKKAITKDIKGWLAGLNQLLSDAERDA